MTQKIENSAKSKMEKSTTLLAQELSKLRTGRASPALLEGIKVDYYGSTLPLNQVASITIPEPRMIIVQPWDKNALPAIEKSLYKSSIGITPNNDGSVIRLAIPSLTMERREELVKLVQKLGEDAKIAIRNIRREANSEVKKEEKGKTISEDESFKAQERIQKLTDDCIKDVDDILAKKEKEIRET
jgi:ribosome recycling factor